MKSRKIQLLICPSGLKKSSSEFVGVRRQREAATALWIVWSGTFRRPVQSIYSRVNAELQTKHFAAAPRINSVMKIKVLLTLLLLASLIFAGQACNRASYGADDRSKIHVGIVFDIGGKDDRSFNAAAWAGVKCAEAGTEPDGKTSCGKPALGIVVRDVEPGNPVSIEPAMRAFAERGYDLVIGVGFAQGPIMQSVANDYPNVHFAIIDGVIFEADGKTPKANVASLVFKEHEGSYLV